MGFEGLQPRKDPPLTNKQKNPNPLLKSKKKNSLKKICIEGWVIYVSKNWNTKGFFVALSLFLSFFFLQPQKGYEEEEEEIFFEQLSLSL